MHRVICQTSQFMNVAFFCSSRQSFLIYLFYFVSSLTLISPPILGLFRMLLKLCRVAHLWSCLQFVPMAFCYRFVSYACHHALVLKGPSLLLCEHAVVNQETAAHCSWYSFPRKDTSLASMSTSSSRMMSTLTHVPLWAYEGFSLKWMPRSGILCITGHTLS